MIDNPVGAVVVVGVGGEYGPIHCKLYQNMLFAGCSIILVHRASLTNHSTTHRYMFQLNHRQPPAVGWTVGGGRLVGSLCNKRSVGVQSRRFNRRGASVYSRDSISFNQPAHNIITSGMLLCERKLLNILRRGRRLW